MEDADASELALFSCQRMLYPLTAAIVVEMGAWLPHVYAVQADG